MFTQRINNLFSLGQMGQTGKVIDRCIARANAIGMSEAEFRVEMGATSGQFSNWKAKPERDLPARLHLKAARVLRWSVDQVLGRETNEKVDPLLQDLNALAPDEQEPIREQVAFLINQAKSKRKKPRMIRNR